MVWKWDGTLTDFIPLTKGFNDITGLVFGRLTAWYPKGREGGHTTWVFKCACGGTIEALTLNVTRGLTQSCGCIKKARASASLKWKGYEDISGQHLKRIMYGAKRRGITYNVTNEYLWELFITQDRKCSLSNITISFSEGTASLDRINSSEGYVVGNLQWVHKDINLMKNKFDQNYFIQMCRKVSEVK